MGTIRLDLGWLRILEAVGRLGSLTRAAAELGISQPAVSYQVRRLEEALGTPLIRRLARGSVLTPAGDALYRAASAGVEGIDAAARDIVRRSRAPAVSIFTDYGFAALWLMPRVAAFRRLHPKVEVHVVASQSLGDDAADLADIAVIFGDAERLGKQASLLMPERVVPVCSPGFLARAGPFADATALARAPLLHLDTSGSPRWFTWESWLATQGVVRQPAQGDLGFNTYGFVVHAAVAEQGLALGWLGLVDAHLADGTLCAIGPEVRREGSGYWLRVSPAAHPASHALRDWLFATVGAG